MVVVRNVPHLYRVLEQAGSQSITYPHAGATRTGSLPDGYRHARYEAVLGDGQPVFERGADGLRAWEAHRGAGLRVVPEDAAVADGGTVVVAARLGPVLLAAPCRIVWVTDEDDRFGFGYGTLPGHPATGEEAFVVERAAAGVVFRVVAFSRPSIPLGDRFGPLVGVLQRFVNNRYLDAMRRHVAVGT